MFQIRSHRFSYSSAFHTRRVGQRRCDSSWYGVLVWNWWCNYNEENRRAAYRHGERQSNIAILTIDRSRQLHEQMLSLPLHYIINFMNDWHEIRHIDAFTIFLVYHHTVMLPSLASSTVLFGSYPFQVYDSSV